MEIGYPAAISQFRTVAVINEAHRITLVQDPETKKFYVKKILDVYNPSVYQYLYAHPVAGVPRIFAYREEAGQLTLIEEYVSGCTLEEMLESGRIDEGMLPELMTDLCEILERLHAADPPIIHRDIKPSNVMVTNRQQIMLLDLNAAKQYHPGASEDTVLLGTQGYAAPEQYGFGASSPQTDIYAFGVLLRELLESVHSDNQALLRIAGQCTHLDPQARYASAAALKADILALQQPAAEKPETAASRLLPPGFRTHTPWKMFLASLGYLFIFCLSLSIRPKNLQGAAVWLERLTVLLFLLASVMVGFNYRNIRKLSPFDSSRYPAVRVVSALLLLLLIGAALMLLMVVLEGLL